MTPAGAFTLDDARRALEACTSKTDAELEAVAGFGEASEPPSLVTPKIALLYAVASHLKLERIEFVPATGGCAGLMAMGVPEFVAFGSG